jgi:hypothetical protein
MFSRSKDWSFRFSARRQDHVTRETETWKKQGEVGDSFKLGKPHDFQNHDSAN